MAELHENGIGPLANSTPEQQWDAGVTLMELAIRAKVIARDPQKMTKAERKKAVDELRALVEMVGAR